MSFTILVTVLLVWTWVWTLNRDPLIHRVGTTVFVPPYDEPTNEHGGSIFWSGKPGEDTIFFHGIIDAPLMRGR